MTFSFHVTVELERESGKFASRDDIEQAIRDHLENSDIGTVDGVGSDGESVYTVTEWNVEGLAADGTPL